MKINDGSILFRPSKYTRQLDSLEDLMRRGSADTSTLFKCALLYDLSNNLKSKPYAGDSNALINLERARSIIGKAHSLNMNGLQFKILRAQVYHDLSYRFSADEKWKFTPDQISQRRARFEEYKRFAKQYYKELMTVDSLNSMDYERLLVTSAYPISN